MRPRLLPVPARRTARLVLDLLVAAWVAIWIWVGVAVADRTDGITILGDGVGRIGEALSDSAEKVGSIDAPLAGDVADEIAEGIEKTGGEVQAIADESVEDIERLSMLLGFSIALIPTLPLLALYLPPRLARGRELGALRRMVLEGTKDKSFDEFLARRAAVSLSYRQLRRVSNAPWRDLEQGRWSELADAELRRVGVNRRVS